MTYEDLIRYKEKEAIHETMIQNILALLEDYGEPSKELKDLLYRTDTTTLNSWIKLAAKAGSLENFMQKIQAE